MSTDIETVRVKCPVTEDNDQGFYIINKEDFDAEKHELFDAPKIEPGELTVPPAWAPKT